MKNNKTIICAILLTSIIGCSKVVTPTPQPTPTPTPQPTVADLQKEAVIKEMGPNCQILPNYFVVKKAEGSINLCIVNPDYTVRSLLLYIP